MYTFYECELSVVCCFGHVGLFLIPGCYKVFDTALFFLFYYSIILLFVIAYKVLQVQISTVCCLMGSDVMSFFLVNPLPLTFLILYFSQIGLQQDVGSNIHDLCVEIPTAIMLEVLQKLKEEFNEFFLKELNVLLHSIAAAVSMKEVFFCQPRSQS